MTQSLEAHPRGIIRKNTLAKAVTAAVVTYAISTPVLSQSLEEVIVTATKRAQSVQDVPLAITALSGEFVSKMNLDDVKDLVSYTPGVTGNSQDSFLDAISVRGIRTQDFGVGGDPSSAFFKNDLYEGRNGSAVSTLYDMDRAEILRGPQGFLFGRSSVGGAFSVHTRRAEVGGSNSGYIALDVAERDRLAVDGAINIPVSDSFAMRLAGIYSEDGAFAKNVFDGDEYVEHEKWAIRWSTAFEADRLSIYTTLEYEDREASGSMYRAIDKGDIWDAFDENLLGVEMNGGSEDLDSDISAGEDDKAEMLALGIRIDYDFDSVTLTSNTGYKDHDYFYGEDYDGTALNINNYGQDQEGEYFQQELRLTSNNEGAFNWYAGLSYYKEEIDTVFSFSGEEDFFCQYYGNYYYAEYAGYTFDNCTQLYADYFGYDFTPRANGLLEEEGRIKGDYSGWATYVNFDYYITEDFNVELGVRYTEDDKDFDMNIYPVDSDLGPYFGWGFSTDGYVKESESWDDTTIRVLAKWQPTDDRMFFASFTEGYKSGGFASFSLANAAGEAPDFGSTDLSQADGYLPTTFDPETVDSFEVGYKDSFFDGQANIDLTVFYYEYEDLQIVFFDGGASNIENVGEVESWGFEGSITASLGENFNIYLATSYLDSEATELQLVCDDPDDVNGCEGSSLFWAPEWTFAGVLDAYFPTGEGAITGSFEVFWEDERGGGWAGLNETMIDDAAIAAVRLGYESDDNWYVEAYVENVFDEFKWDGQNNNGAILPSHYFGPQRPRTFGIRVGANWE